MPRLHFPDQALVLRMVERCVTSGKPLVLAHDHGVYLCTDAMKEPDGPCVCAYAKGCNPRQTDNAFETANALVGFDDFGIAIPLGGQDALLADLKRGHRFAIAFGRSAVTILTQAPPTKQSQPTSTARGRGAESPPTARTTPETERTDDMTTATKKKTTKGTKSKSATKASSSGDKLRKAAIAEIGDRIAALDAAEAPMSEPTAATATTVAKSTKPTKEPKARKPNAAGSARAAKAPKQAKPKRVSALDAAAIVLKGAKEPMNTDALIVEMATRKLWTSPNGQTPAQTLYAALTREINSKGKQSRFTKVERGLFAFNGKAS